MRRFHFRGREKHPARFRPLVESLEDRRVLSCTFNVPNGSALAGGELIITGDAGKNNIQITDFGYLNTSTNANPHIQVACESGTQTFRQVGKITINAQAGDDNIVYNVVGSTSVAGPVTYRAQREVNVDLGEGNNSLTVLVSAPFVAATSPPGPAPALLVNVTGGTAKDTVNVQLNGNLTSPGTSLRVNANLGPGNDSFTGTVAGSLNGAGSQVELNVDGGPGKDTLVVNAPGNVDPGASLIANLIGGPIKLKKNDTDRDSIVVNYAVVLRGILALDLDGGAGDDRIAVNVTANGGSTGLLQADLFGRAGDDRLRIGVRGVAVDAIQSDVFLKGGPGTDRALHTDNIDLADIKGCEIDTVID